jgi:heptosyltransferase II
MDPELVRPSGSSDSRPASVIVQTSFLGDMILTTPLLAELAKRGPVDVVATPASAQLLTHDPGVRRILVYDKRGSGSGVRGLWSAARAISKPDRGSAPERAYLAQGSMRSAALALLAGCRERIGFDSSAGRALYTRQVAYRPDSHHAERLFALAEPGAGDAAAIRPRLFPGPADVAAVDDLLAGDDTPFIVLAPGSVWNTKRWPFYADLARHIPSTYRIAVVGSDADREHAAAIELAAPRRVLDACGKLSLLASAELIGRARAIVTNDSAPLHLASAMGTPTLAIFGPTVPEFGFGPLAPSRIVAGNATLDCRPCDRHGPRRCPLGHWRCMKELTPVHIAALLDQLLSTTVQA